MNDKVVVVYKSNTKKQLRLTWIDIETLLFLFEQEFLTQQQLFRFQSIFVSTKKTPRYDTFKKRIQIFKEHGLLNIHHYYTNRKRGVRLNVLQLTAKGCQLLFHSGFLDIPPEGLKIPNAPTKWERTLSAKDVILDVIQFELNEHGVVQSSAISHLFVADAKKSIEEFERITWDDVYKTPLKPIVVHEEQLIYSNIMFHMEHSFEPFPTSNVALSIDKTKSQTTITPEWLFEINDSLLSISTELNRRTINSINITIPHYIDLLNEQYGDGKPFYVLSVHVDNTFPFTYVERTKRIQNLHQELDTLLESNPLLSIYMCRYKQKTRAITNMLEDIWGYNDTVETTINFFYVFNKWLEEQNKAEVVTILRHAEHITEPEELVSFPLYEQFDGITEFFFVKEKQGLYVQPLYFIPLVMREGDLTAQYRLFKLSNQITSLKAHTNAIIKVAAIYRTSDELENDIQRSDLAVEEIVYGSLDNLNFATFF